MKNLFIFCVIIFFQSFSAQKYFGENPDYNFSMLSGGFIEPTIHVNDDGLLYFSYKKIPAVVTRYLSNGNKDANFEIKIPNTTGVVGKLYEKDGMIYVLDDKYFLNEIDRVLRFFPNGNLDTSFGNNGFIEIPNNVQFNFYDDVFCVLDTNSILKKYNYNGEELGSFSLASYSSNFLRSKEGYFYTFSNSANNLMLINRLDSDGNKVLEFGNNGDAFCKIGTPVLGKDNSIYIIEPLGNDLMRRYVTKYSHIGFLDTSFANNGTFSFTYQVPQGSVKYINPPHILFEEGNKIVFIFGLYGEPNYRGYRSFEGNYFLRLHSDGSPDSTFNDTSSNLYLKNNNLSKCQIIKDSKIHCWAYWQATLDAQFMSNQFFRYSQLSAIDLDATPKVIQNPVKDYLEINFLQDKKMKSLTIFDVSGKEVFKGKNNKSDVSHLLKGLYFVFVETDAGNFKFKIIKE